MGSWGEEEEEEEEGFRGGGDMPGRGALWGMGVLRGGWTVGGFMVLEVNLWGGGGGARGGGGGGGFWGKSFSGI